MLLDLLSSVASDESPEQISEFVKGGAVKLLIETINNKGISVDGMFSHHIVTISGEKIDHKPKRPTFNEIISCTLSVQY